MEATQALRDTENAIRDLIYDLLSKRYKSEWEKHLGVTEKRLAIWKERQSVEKSRQKGGPIEERLLYYADFYDLWESLKKNWDVFSEALGDRKTVEVWLGELERLRDPNAHSRDLLPFQKHLILGIAGDVRARIVRYRSKMDSIDDYFPRIESARDSVGHSWTPTGCSSRNVVIREGDVIEFVITATDPMGQSLEYGYKWHPLGAEFWSESNSFRLTVGSSEIGKMKELHLKIRSHREPKAKYSCDDFVMFHYDVLPRK